MSPRRLAPTALLLVLAAAGGCGGASRLSPEQYRIKADAVCGEQRAQLDNLGSPVTTGQLTPFLEQGTTLTERAAKRYAALRPPAELERDHKAAVALQRSELAALRRLLGDIKRAPADARASFQRAAPRLSAQDAQLRARYEALGLRECGRG